MVAKNKPAPWLVAAWPGMGNVAVVGAGYLINSLELKPFDELPAADHFDVGEVHVRDGVISRPRFPRSLFFRATIPGSDRDLIVFLGEAQPARGSLAFANALLDKAQSMGVERVITFASLASQLHPSQRPRVFGAGTSPEALGELTLLGAETLEDGQIGGMNGVLLGAAAERGLSGVCMLGEMPFFAAHVANPRAAKAVLEVFRDYADLEINLEPLEVQAEAVDQALIEALDKMKNAEGTEDEESDDEGAEEIPAPKPPPTKTVTLTKTARTRIEKLFGEARKDKSKAATLKALLDQLGVFKDFENRFLDLFKHAE